jgi:hypothetical protein
VRIRVTWHLPNGQDGPVGTGPVREEAQPALSPSAQS